MRRRPLILLSSALVSIATLLGTLTRAKRSENAGQSLTDTQASYPKGGLPAPSGEGAGQESSSTPSRGRADLKDRIVELPPASQIVSERLSQADAVAALAALREEAATKEAMPEELQEKVLLFFEAWGRRDGESALAYARQGLASAITMRSMAALTGWTEADPRSAKAWVEDFPAGRERALLAESIVGQLRQRDWKAAAEWAKQFASDEFGRHPVAALNDEAGPNNPDVLAWMMDLPVGPGSIGAVQDVFQDWTSRDPEAASGFLAAHRDGALRDQAVAALVKNVANDDPEAAAMWAGEIQDGALRAAVKRALTAQGNP